MKKLAIVASLAAVPFLLTSAVAGPGPHSKPKPDKAMKTAIECVLKGMEAGAYATMTSEALADYCIDAAIRVHGADYDPAP
jgi:hypothetical protein